VECGSSWKRDLRRRRNRDGNGYVEAGYAEVDCHCTLCIAESSHLYTISLTLRIPPNALFRRRKTMQNSVQLPGNTQRSVSRSGPSVPLSWSSLLLLLDFLRRKNSPNAAVTL